MLDGWPAGGRFDEDHRNAPAGAGGDRRRSSCWARFPVGRMARVQYGQHPQLSSTPSAAFTAARVATRAMLSASTGCVAVTALNYHRSKVWSLPTTCYGIVAGLVAITASCNSISAWAACLVGRVGAPPLLCGLSIRSLHVLRIDDAVDAFAVHAVPGAWGLIAASLFSGGSGGAASTGSPGPTAAADNCSAPPPSLSSLFPFGRLGWAALSWAAKSRVGC